MKECQGLSICYRTAQRGWWSADMNAASKLVGQGIIWFVKYFEYHAFLGYHLSKNSRYHNRNDYNMK